MGFKNEILAGLGSWYVIYWEDNIKQAGPCWKGQAMILIVQEDKQCKRLIQMK